MNQKEGMKPDQVSSPPFDSCELNFLVCVNLFLQAAFRS